MAENDVNTDLVGSLCEATAPGLPMYLALNGCNNRRLDSTAAGPCRACTAGAHLTSQHLLYAAAALPGGAADAASRFATALGPDVRCAQCCVHEAALPELATECQLAQQQLRRASLHLAVVSCAQSLQDLSSLPLAALAAMMYQAQQRAVQRPHVARFCCGLASWAGLLPMRPQRQELSLHPAQHAQGSLRAVLAALIALPCLYHCRCPSQ